MAPLGNYIFSLAQSLAPQYLIHTPTPPTYTKARFHIHDEGMLVEDSTCRTVIFFFSSKLFRNLLVRYILSHKLFQLREVLTFLYLRDNVQIGIVAAKKECSAIEDLINSRTFCTT